MVRGVRIFAAAGFLLPAAAGGQSQAMPHAPLPPQIVVQANGSIRVTPDRASLRIAVQTREKTAALAAASNARRQRAVIDTLRTLGIPANRISTVDYSINPDMRYEPEREPVIIGYVVSNSVLVEVQKLEQVGMLIDAALAKGANQISSLQFESSNTDAPRRTALADAIKRARGDAEAAAAAAGGVLGELLEVTTMSSSPPPIIYGYAKMARADAMQAETPISAGSQDLTVSVTTRWAYRAR